MEGQISYRNVSKNDHGTYSRDQLSAKFAASDLGVVNAYDSVGRLVSSTNSTGGTSRTLSYQYNANGGRTRVTHPDGGYFSYEYDGLDRVTAIRENGGDALATIAYDTLGRRQTLGRGVNVAATSYGYDPVGRLTSLAQDLSGSAYDVTQSFTYTPASQMASRTMTNDAYAFGGNVNVNRPYAVNGLNQYTSAGTEAFTYDPNGNLTSQPGIAFTYDTENRLVSSSGAGKNAALTYDPLGRLYQTTDAGADPAKATRFLYDGDALVAEYDGNNNLLRRYVHGPGVDEPLVWYEGAALGSAGRRYLFANHQGSVIAVADAAGAMLKVKSYDPYGIPGGISNGKFDPYSRFQYTGQIVIPEVDLYHYKARAYSPTLGRFLQTDPIGYDDQVNLYAYVGNDPVNATDPDGKFAQVIIGAIVGAGADIAIQMVVEGKNLDDVNISSAAVGAVTGATGLGAFSQAMKAYRAVQVARSATRIADRAQSNAQSKSVTGSSRQARQAQYHADKKSATAKLETDKALKTASGAAGAIAGAKMAKEILPEVTVGDVKKATQEALEKLKEKIQ